jgi:polysaccharide biosynthesis protein PslH
MHILFLSRWFPYPANNGAKLRVFNLLKALTEQHRVSLLSFGDTHTTPAHIDAMRQWCDRVEMVPYTPFAPEGGLARLAFLDNRPRSVVDTHSPALEIAAQRIHSVDPVDVAVASQIDMAAYPLALKGVRRVLEEVEVSIFAAQAREATSPAARLRKTLMWGKWRGYLRQTLASYNACTVAADAEVEAVRACAPGFDEIHMIPNGADIVSLSGVFAQPEHNRLVYAGALSYHVNLEGLGWFVSQVLPEVVRQIPEARLSVSGRTQGLDPSTLPKHPALALVGYQDDIRPFVQRGWLSIAPEQRGGGSRLKILESMALGTPVVATRASANGTRAEAGRELLVTDSPAEMSDAIIRLMRDPQLRAALAEQARIRVARDYDWRLIGAQLVALVEQVAAKMPK